MSPADSKYILICNDSNETVLLRSLFNGFSVVPDSPEATVMMVDNQVATSLSHNMAMNRRNKHIDVRFHFTRKMIEEGTLDLRYCPTG